MSSPAVTLLGVPFFPMWRSADGVGVGDGVGDGLGLGEGVGLGLGVGLGVGVGQLTVSDALA